jgi:hypothetical protein
VYSRWKRLAQRRGVLAGQRDRQLGCLRCATQIRIRRETHVRRGVAFFGEQRSGFGADRVERRAGALRVFASASSPPTARTKWCSP